MKLQQALENFSQSFASDSGFTYDSNKIEFTGGLMRQKDQRPGTNATFGANYGSSINANWGNGVLTGTAGGGAAVSGGKLVLTGGVKYADYAGVGNANHPQIGTFRFKITPNYSGSPASQMAFLTQSSAAGANEDLLYLFHNSSDGTIALFVRDDGGSLVIANSFGVFSPVAGTEYEIELNYNFTSGATRVFLNGVQSGSTLTTTLTRTMTLNLLRIGANVDASIGSNSSFNDFVVFSSVQHTAGYTPGYTVADFIYGTSEVALPAFTHALLGTFLSYTSFSVTEVDSPRYTIKTGSGSKKYWNGSAWVASDGTYSQASLESDINSNLATLTDASGATTVIIYVYFPDSNTVQASADTLAFAVMAQSDYPVSNPTITPNAGILADALESFEETLSVVSGSDDIKYIVSVSGQDKYWNGSAWVNSDGSYSQANVPSDINTNCGSLSISSGVTLKIKAILHSNDGQSTPEIETVTIGHNYFSSLTAPTTRTVEGFYLDPSGQGIQGAIVTIALKREAKQYREAGDAIIGKSIQRTTDSEGRFEADLIVSSEYENGGTYVLTISDSASGLTTQFTTSQTAIEFTVPDGADALNVTSRISAIA